MLRNKIKPIVLFVLTLLVLSSTAQNILFINNTEGVTNDTVKVLFSINNDTAFISFQCDMILPNGFSYIPGSITLSNRSADHVINATKVAGNTLRILSYSLSNAQFLNDSGTVATLLLTTPHEAGTYYLPLENGIIGNAESVNILDSLSGGDVILKPVGIAGYLSPNDLQVILFPNPFSKNLYFSLNQKGISEVEIKTWQSNGSIITIIDKTTDPGSFINLTFNAEDLLRKNAVTGIYYIQFLLKTDNYSTTLVKKIYYKR